MDKNNLMHWFGPLRDSGVRVPETVITLTNVKLYGLLSGVVPEGFGDFIEEFGQSIASLPGPPYFIRTGHTSGKHCWKETCFLEDINELPGHVAALVEMSAAHDLPVDTWVAREFIRARPRFHAFGGTPIAREHRFFFGDHKVICHHPYYPMDSIRNADDPNWRYHLSCMHNTPPSHIGHLVNQTNRVAAEFDGAWSVDWLKCADGDWMAIDMSLYKDAWHWPGCPYVPVGRKHEAI